MGSWLFGNNASVNDPTPPATTLRIQTSMQGRPITILWGTQRVAGNLVWQGGFRSETRLVGAVGSNNWLDHIFSEAQPIFQTFYFTSCMFALCNGTIHEDTASNRVWNGTTSTTISGLGFTVFRGTYDQETWSYLTASFPAQALPYREIAMTVQADFSLGSSPNLPVLNFEPQSDIAGYGPTSQDANAADVVLDLLSNDAYGVNFPFYRMDQQLTDYFAYCLATGMVVSPILIEQVSTQGFLSDLVEATNSTFRWSCGTLSIVPWGDQAITAGAITTVTDNPYTIPPSTDAFYPTIQIGTGTFVADLGVAYAAGGAFVNVAVTVDPAVGQYSVTVGGLYRFNPTDATVPILISFTQAATASYTPNVTPIYSLDEDDFLPNQGSIGSGAGSSDEPIVWVMKRQSDLLNIIKYEYLDRSNNYDPVAIDFKDEASIVTYGARPSALKTRHMFALPDPAQQSASLQCIREQIPATCQFTLGPEFILLDVEDIVTLTRPSMGLDEEPVRILEIQENDDGSLTFTAEVFMGTATAPLYGTQDTNGNNLDALADPGGLADVVIFSPPDDLVNTPAGQTPIMTAVIGVNLAQYGGSNVYYSVDNVTYNAVGAVAPSTMGFLTAELPTHADPDNVNTLSVDLTESAGVLAQGNAVDVTLGIPTCYVDGEVVAYQVATLTSAYNYNLTALKRGAFGTTPGTHVNGSSFVLVNGAVFLMFVSSALIGSTVYFKFQPFNVLQGGIADVSTLTVYPYVVGDLPPVQARSFAQSFSADPPIAPQQNPQGADVNQPIPIAVV